MSARDVFHESVKSALMKDNWVITHDPLRLKFSEDDRLRIDLGAEQLLAAERGVQKIAVEVKSFLSESAMFDFHLALGTIFELSTSTQKFRARSIALFGSSHRCL